MPTFQVIDTGSGQDTFYQGMVKDAANWAILEALVPVGTTATQTLSNKTLTTPTIAATGWTNANHAHTAANSGGILSTFSVVASTRAMDAASGDVAYAHGLGTTPKAVIAVGVATSKPMSVGFADGTAAGDHGSAVNNLSAQQKLMLIWEDTGKTQDAVVKTLDATNVTLTWTRTGATTSATATFYLLCMS